MRGELARGRFGFRRGTPRWPGRLAFLGLLAALSSLLGLATGCDRGDPEPQAERPAQVSEEAEWAWLGQTKQRLDERREKLAQVRAAVPPTNPPADPGARTPPSVAALEKEVRGLGEEFSRRLVDFINSHPAVEGEPLSGRLLEAVRMKSDEDILLAREHIERGGDYRRAIDIYESALAVDPDNPRLLQELESARARRYMTPERFAKVQEGMSQDQVRATLGQPNLNNVREYPEKGITAWFYTKDPQGGAAAVWFRRQGQGAVVYELDFNAVGPGRGPAAGPSPAVPPRGAPSGPDTPEPTPAPSST